MKTIVKMASLNKILQNRSEEQKIVIYGAGDAGKRVLKYILSLGVKKEQVMLVVTSMQKEEEIYGVTVREVNELQEQADLLILIAAMGNKKYEMTKMALTYSTNVYTFEEDVFFEIGEQVEEPFEQVKRDEEWMKKWITQPQELLRYEVHLTEHCNLNCKSCFHFSSIAEEEFLDVTEYEKDCKRLSELFGGVASDILLMGGEPLLHPDIEKFMEITRTHFPLAKINIITNGILLLKMPETFWQKCEQYGIVIEPTKYPIGLDYEAIEAKADEYNVAFRYFNKGMLVMESWYAPIDIEGKQPIEDNFYGCDRANQCITLKHGRMYTCIIPAHAHHLAKHFNIDLPDFKKDGIDIYEAKNGKEILEFLTKPVSACAYCDRKRNTYGEPWSCSKKAKEEWI